MEKFTITNVDNTRMNVDLVRYFKFKNDHYLIYTLNEIDEKGYYKLYLVKVMEELGLPVIHNIRNDKEWSGMQTIIKKVLKEIKSNKRKYLEDLDYNNIQEIKIVEPRHFKLDKKLVDLLSSSYDLSKETKNNNIQENSFPSLNLTDTNELNMSKEINIDDKNIESQLNINYSNLETIEETVLNQDTFNSISDTSSTVNDIEQINIGQEQENINDVKELSKNSEIQEQKLSNNSEIQEQKLNNNSETQEQKLSKNSEIQEKELSNNPEIQEQELSNKNSSKIIETTVLNDNQEVAINNFDNNNKYDSQNSEIDYKKLYLAEKEEKKAINMVVNSLLEQLTKYKEKYGELEK